MWQNIQRFFTNLSKAQKILLLVLAVLLVIGGIALAFRNNLQTWLFRPTNSTVQPGITAQDQTITAVATGLRVPWEIAFLPSGDMLVSERGGTIKRFGNNDQVYTVSGARENGEGGLLGMALHPQFERNSWLYLYYSQPAIGGSINTVQRYRLQDDQLTEATRISSDIPAAAVHDGGRIAFGPDGYLYIGTGDAGDADSAQDVRSLAGKILRVQDDGRPAPGNPFNTAVYSYGHRNVQGLAWDDKQQLWATEHGPSGGDTGQDELNLIEKGVNYGWPIITGDKQREGMRTPVANSGPNETWAPAGLAYKDGSLFFAGLRGQTLYEAHIKENNTVALKAHFAKTYGRLRAVISHDNSLYLSTSNTDGRGTPQANDDKVLRVPMGIFQE